VCPKVHLEKQSVLCRIYWHTWKSLLKNELILSAYFDLSWMYKQCYKVPPFDPMQSPLYEAHTLKSLSRVSVLFYILLWSGRPWPLPTFPDHTTVFFYLHISIIYQLNSTQGRTKWGRGCSPAAPSPNRN
jgi:hypothetical protein